MTNTKGLGLRTCHKALANSSTERVSVVFGVAQWPRVADMEMFRVGSGSKNEPRCEAYFRA
jgi:hypothetical protein